MSQFKSNGRAPAGRIPSHWGWGRGSRITEDSRLYSKSTDLQVNLSKDTLIATSKSCLTTYLGTPRHT